MSKFIFKLSISVGKGAPPPPPPPPHHHHHHTTTTTTTNTTTTTTTPTPPLVCELLINDLYSGGCPGYKEMKPILNLKIKARHFIKLTNWIQRKSLVFSPYGVDYFGKYFRFIDQSKLLILDQCWEIYCNYQPVKRKVTNCTTMLSNYKTQRLVKLKI